MRQDRARNRGRGGEFIARLPPHFHAVARQNFERGLFGPARSRVCVLAHHDGAGESLLAPVLAHRLGDREDVAFGETAVEGCAPVATGAEGHAFGGVLRIRLPLVIIALQLGHVNFQLRGRGLAG